MPKTELEWEDFWRQLWLNLFHTLAIISVVVGFIWFGWWLFFGPSISSVAPILQRTKYEYVYIGTKEQQALQKAFHFSMANEKRPCALKLKGDKYSDVRGCRLFRLSLGASVGTFHHILEGSGYFPGRGSLIETCKQDKQKCIYTHFIHRVRDGLTVTGSFAPRSTDDQSLALKEIVLWAGPGSNPYFDPEALLATFIKVIGPPDVSSARTTIWGSPSRGSFEVNLHTNNEVYVALREGTSP